MVHYSVRHIASIIAPAQTVHDERMIEHLLTDSRRIIAPASSLFFALQGYRRDGHQFIAELYARGVRAFVVAKPVPVADFPEAVFILVPDTLAALQHLAAWHRAQFSIPVIGITGSNGKTIVKEWLFQLLQPDYTIVRSPKSYNSQIGVPLSVWGLHAQATLAIFEAGISRPGEMEKLERIIQPTIGVLTNIGEAHSEGFTGRQEKEAEKRKLFVHAQMPASLTIVRREARAGATTITATPGEGQPLLTITIPFTDEAAVLNAVSCWEVLRMLQVEQAVIEKRMLLLQPVSMRLELKKGINHCAVINDSYSADPGSLQLALNFLEQQATGKRKTVILSDFQQSALPYEELYKSILNSLVQHGVQRVIGIGDKISAALLAGAEPVVPEVQTFASTDQFLQQFRASQFREETILVKGARAFRFEAIVQLLEQKVHQTILEIDLNAVVHNLKAYQQFLQPSTKVMAMVKAFAYGSGGAEIAGILQFHKVDYLGVAYADEGVELRKAGISLPIMVMNPEEAAFDAILEYNLEPEIYSPALFDAFEQFLLREGVQQYPVHVEMETGMNRLGFSAAALPDLANRFRNSPTMRLQSFFTHLSASEEAAQDAFTKQQFELFSQGVAIMEAGIGYTFIRHIANSAAAIRHPYLQCDMVRLGIGLYGVDSGQTSRLSLQPVATLKSTIAQIKKLLPGESVSYNRKGRVEKESLVATIRLGYADGYPRRLGNGKGKVLVGGRLVPILGTVCMDMFMVDVTEVPGVQEGDEVIIFGKQLPVQQVAEWAETIPYEIMTGISQRVKRVYFEE